MSHGTARLRHVEESMGTVFSFDIRGVRDEPRVRAGLHAAVASLHRADELFSAFRPDSQILRLGRGELALSACAREVAEVLELCAAAERESGGWFTSRYAGGLDPTGLVKGWAVERAVRMIASSGAGSVCLNGGGDIQLLGGPWRVGISDPLRPGGLATVIETGEGLGVATSGPAERGCHVIDPYTGRPPVGGLASVTVVCPEGLTAADTRATAAYAMGARARGWLEGLPGTEGFAVLPDGRTWTTSGFHRYVAKVSA
ncbi:MULTISPECIES: FAD:protein FMN transferase [unclassified Streptomyces]|uniref:FAD:protein FMN transferase n=1 Tax=unclassified Streptomyces TaxID=2593676 RepID=UPI00362D7E94